MQTKERLLHHVTITVFQKPHDEEAAVLHGLDTISPVPTAELLAQEKEYDPERPNTIHYRMKDIEFSVQQMPSDEGTLVIYTLFFKRMHWANAFARNLIACMIPQEKEHYLAEPELLLDPDTKLSLRLDKQLLMKERLVLTQDGNCYQVKAAVAAYPKSEERIVEALRRMLQE